MGCESSCTTLYSTFCCIFSPTRVINITLWITSRRCSILMMPAEWPSDVPHLPPSDLSLFILHSRLYEQQWRSLCSRSSPPRREWPPCSPSTVTGKVKACVSAFSRDHLGCHTYFHHIKSHSSFSWVVIGKVSSDNILFICQLMAVIAPWTEYFFLNVTLGFT